MSLCVCVCVSVRACICACRDWAMWMQNALETYWPRKLQEANIMNLSFSPYLPFPWSSYFSLLPKAHKSLPDGNSQRLQQQSHRGLSEEGQAWNNQAQSSLLSACQAAQVHRVTLAWPLTPFHCLLFLSLPRSQLSGVNREAIQSYVVHQMCLLFPWQPTHLEHIFRLFQCH